MIASQCIGESTFLSLFKKILQQTICGPVICQLLHLFWSIARVGLKLISVLFYHAEYYIELFLILPINMSVSSFVFNDKCKLIWNKVTHF